MNNFDAIVIGSGISGGWAAKELCEKGLKTLVLEKGRMVKHIVGIIIIDGLFSCTSYPGYNICTLLVSLHVQCTSPLI